MNSEMVYVIQSSKTFQEASEDLGRSVEKHAFGVLHVHDLGETLRKKGVEFKEECRVFEVCNPVQAGKVLSADLHMNMVLPCRISVFTENGETRIGMIKTEAMLAGLSSDPDLAGIADEVGTILTAMIDDAA